LSCPIVGKDDYQSFLILHLLVRSAPKTLQRCYQFFLPLGDCVGWTSNRMANSAMVSSPLWLPWQPLALKSDYTVLRFLFNFLLLFILFILGADSILKPVQFSGTTSPKLAIIVDWRYLSPVNLTTLAYISNGNRWSLPRLFTPMEISPLLMITKMSAILPCNTMC